MSRVIGDYYRDDTERVHLAPCTDMPATAKPFFAGQGISLHELVHGVANHPERELCGSCWPGSALRYERAIETETTAR